MNYVYAFDPINALHSSLHKHIPWRHYYINFFSICYCHKSSQPKHTEL